jgi:outer membrane protein OmpA-like peptidoglycan-associated protein
MAPETGAAPDMQASFAASKAPALDPSVSQFVPQQIISRYKETAAAAAVAPPEGAPVRHHHRKKIKTSQRLIRLHYASVSKHNRYALSLIRYFRSESPERFASAQGKSLKSRNLSQAAYQLDPSLFASSGNAALAVVAFTQETTLLDRGARDRIQSAARTFAARGRSGYMRVVGHGASLADNLPRATRFNNFERSEAQATAVARELIRDGVPAEKVVVEAIGNGSPGDHMATGTGPSAEIFLQS